MSKFTFFTLYRVSILSCASSKNGHSLTGTQFYQNLNTPNYSWLNSTPKIVQDQFSSPKIDQVMNVLQEDKKNIFHIQTCSNRCNFTQLSAAMAEVVVWGVKGVSGVSWRCQGDV